MTISEYNVYTSGEETKTTPTYSRSYRVLHWMMGLGFSMLLIAGQQFNFNLTDAYKIAGLRYHSTIGVVVLLCALLLLMKRFIRRDSRPNSGLSGLKQLMANGAQASLYFLAVFVPLSGLATAYFAELPTMFFGLFNLSNGVPDEILFVRIRSIHELGTFAGMALLAMHAGAALYHHFVKRDGVLTAMTGELKLLKRVKTGLD